MDILNEECVLEELCRVFGEIDGKLCPVMPAEVFASVSVPAMWIVLKGGSVSEKYVDGSERLAVPFELKLRHRDIDPSDRISAVASLEKLCSAACDTSNISRSEYPVTPESADRGSAVYSVAMKYEKTVYITDDADRKVNFILTDEGDRVLLGEGITKFEVHFDGELYTRQFIDEEHPRRDVIGGSNRIRFAVSATRGDGADMLLGAVERRIPVKILSVSQTGTATLAEYVILHFDETCDGAEGELLSTGPLTRGTFDTDSGVFLPESDNK